MRPKRGDSRRDFYAKALALFGLGLLGATAAVVDNWPAGSVVSTAMVRGSDPAAAPLRLDLRKFNVTPDAPAASRVASVRAAVQSAPLQHSGSLSLTSVGVTFADQPPAAPASFSVESGLPQGVQFSAVGLVEAPQEAPVVFIGPIEDHDYRTSAPGARSAAVGATMNDGFFSGAVKKTQDTLAKTGSTIADAFRAVGGAVGAVGGAVKRVMPF